jgi:hypothetical protein
VQPRRAAVRALSGSGELLIGRLLIGRPWPVVVMMAFCNPGRSTRSRRGRVRTGTTVPANTEHIVQALLQCREPAAPKAILAKIVISAPWIVLLRHSGFFDADHYGENAQNA